MRKIPQSPKTVFLLLLLLFALILGQSLLEYRSGRQAVIDLMHNQAEALIMSVARASEKGLVTYEIQQRKIEDHLFTVAEMVDRLEQTRPLKDAELQEIALGNGLSSLIILGTGGIMEKAVSDTTFIGSVNISPQFVFNIMADGRLNIPLGFIDISGNGKRSFAVARQRGRGGVILAAIDANELLTLRRTFGAGSVIDAIGQSPGVSYAGIIRSGILVAASKSLSAETLDGWLLSDSLFDDSLRTRIRMTEKAGEVFEAVAPFAVNGESFGSIVIGIDTNNLDLIAAKLRRDIVWRSILFLVVGMVALAGVILRQNYRLLSNQYAEIQRDVQRLEGDKAISARLVAMGELAGGVAHEIRNPLNAIRVIIQRLEREFRPQSDEAEYKELTSIVRKETDKINESVKNFLTLAKPPVLRKTRSDLNASVREAASLFQPRAQSKGCEVITELDNLPPLVFDTELVHQALLNLFENSLAAVGDDGMIEVRTYHKSGNCYIEVSDNGPGIKDDEKSRVFDLYYTTKPTGTGLGLPMVLRIIKEHGGLVELTDSRWGGALFRLELPID